MSILVTDTARSQEPWLVLTGDCLFVGMWDARDTAAFGGVHIPGSINIGLAKQTANWIGMVIEPSVELILVVPDEKAYDSMCTQLHRIGYDTIIGYLYDGISAWQEMGYPISQLWQISPAKLREKLKKTHQYLFDVRTPMERRNGYIEQCPVPAFDRAIESGPGSAQG